MVLHQNIFDANIPVSCADTQPFSLLEPNGWASSFINKSHQQCPFDWLAIIKQVWWYYFGTGISAVDYISVLAPEEKREK